VVEISRILTEFYIVVTLSDNIYDSCIDKPLRTSQAGRSDGFVYDSYQLRERGAIQSAGHNVMKGRVVEEEMTAWRVKLEAALLIACRE